MKLADTNDLIVHCIQITLIERKIDASSIPLRNLPFDINRVRSMVDETNLSKNARQFLNSLQKSEKQRQTPFNLSQMMTMMQGLSPFPMNEREEKKSVLFLGMKTSST